MSLMRVKYEGALRCQALHIDSGTEIQSDAPKDNQGNGERFSPTDLLCTSLATCTLTIMGIKAKALGVNLDGIEIGIEKIMSKEPPRRVAEIVLTFDWKERLQAITPEQLDSLKRSALACPVALSLHPDVKKTIRW
ncbi:OsmC family peroxiredoxin [bacterium]|nr:OsmC family peroxiredoxin [bacterium]